tara:strand:- start:288 stop:425 length:138 start_codon:yes stop_codon:yes gene_type:complete
MGQQEARPLFLVPKDQQEQVVEQVQQEVHSQVEQVVQVGLLQIHL